MINTSFLRTAKLLDPASPPSSLTELKHRMRWVEGKEPPDRPLSMRKLLRRFEPLLEDDLAARRYQHRFLFYNTFLLGGFQMDLDEFILTLPGNVIYILKLLAVDLIKVLQDLIDSFDIDIGTLIGRIFDIDISISTAKLYCFRRKWNFAPKKLVTKLIKTEAKREEKTEAIQGPRKDQHHSETPVRWGAYFRCVRGI